MTLLLLEDNLNFMSQLDKFFQKEFPDLVVLHARLIDEAHSFISTVPEITFAVLDSDLPDGKGFDFLCDLKSAHAGAKVILMYERMERAYEERAEELDIIHSFEKPFPLEQLKSVLSRVIVPPPPKTGFQAVLSNITLLDILQIRCTSRVTQGLEISSGPNRGRIFLRKGEIIYAEAGPESHSTLFQEEAVRQILCWEVGKVTELRGDCPFLQDIHRPWQEIILDAVRLADEMRGKAYDDNFRN